MIAFDAKDRPTEKDAIAPDGSHVRLLIRFEAQASTATFWLPPGGVARAVTHKTVDEIWYVLTGHGKMWRSQEGREEAIDLKPGRCVTVPLGTQFQFRADLGESLEIFGVTLPAWPTDREEAIRVEDHWTPNMPVPSETMSLPPEPKDERASL